MRRIGVIILVLSLSCAADNGALGGVEEDSPRPGLGSTQDLKTAVQPSRSLDPVEAIRTAPDYVEQRVHGVGLGAWGGPLRLDIELDAKTKLPTRSIYVARNAFFVEEDPFTDGVEIALTGQLYPSEQAARAAVEASPLNTAGHVLYAHYRGEEGIIFPTLLSKTTAPALTRAVKVVLATEKTNAQAASALLLKSVFLAMGARYPLPVTAGVAPNGRLILDPGRQLSRNELEVAVKLVFEKRTVRVLTESTSRTADFLVDGVLTELKTLSHLTSRDLSGAMARRILEGAGQGSYILVDVRSQAGMTLELAKRAVSRAYGADKSRRIQQIRVIGDGFDFAVPRSP
jgi:Contact-dependent growth inhibition CdiA C-terminal domain